MEVVIGGSEADIRLHNFIPRSLSDALSGALTCIFTFFGALAGAITGAVAGRTSDCGAFRGAGLGALAGAVLSMEILETLCVFSRQGLAGIPNSSRVNFMEELLRGRLSELHFLPEVLTTNHLQVSVRLVEVAYKGLSEDSLRCLPWHRMSDEIKPIQAICCPICLEVKLLVVCLTVNTCFT
ncbi:unnamed protein product [Lactuca saligna]|uniref:Uncharacterized protein n=1 Tax=Lactuca saligna TaxID=75948 RepID=A0AA36E478_LACSI|nr:unnamed protein product [Lactuca saligna]